MNNEGAGKKNCNPESCTTTTTQAPASTTTTPAPSTDCKCGLAKRSTRIVGGTTTEVNEYPWQVGVTYTYSSTFFCGGTLISDQWVMTAAHCTRGDQPSQLKVVLGEHNTGSTSESDQIPMGVTRIVEHPSYSSSTLNNDFSLIKLDSKVDFAAHPHIRPVCLPTSTSNNYAGEFAIVTGWGTTSSSGSLSAALREVRVKVLSNQECKATSYSNAEIKDQMVCAGVTAGGKDSCQGDSGGPLISSKSGDGVTAGQNYDLIGVVSWGYGCAVAEYPGVYARISTVLDWISSTTSGSGTCART